MNAGSVITNDNTKQKVGFSHKPYTFPAFSISDPNYTKTVPKNQTANGIVDTIAHLLEQYFNTSENGELVDRFCESSIKYMMEISRDLLDNPNDYNLREAMMYTSLVVLNGSLSVCGLDGGVHAIEHSVSGVFDIPHGAGLAIITPNWMKYVGKKKSFKIIKLGQRVFNLNNEGIDDIEFCDMVADKFREFFQSLSVPSTLGEFNITRESLDELTDNTFVSGDSIGSYVKLYRDDVREILNMSM